MCCVREWQTDRFRSDAYEEMYDLALSEYFFNFLCSTEGLDSGMIRNKKKWLFLTINIYININKNKISVKINN